MESPQKRHWLRRNMITLSPLVILIVAYSFVWTFCVSVQKDKNYVTYWYQAPFTSHMFGRSDYFLNERIANYAAFNNSGDAKSWQEYWPQVDYAIRFNRFGPAFIWLERAHQHLMGIHTCYPTRYITKQEMEDFRL